MSDETNVQVGDEIVADEKNTKALKSASDKGRMVGRKEYKIPIRHIVALENEIVEGRYPFSDALLAQGYGVLTQIDGSDKPPLWGLGLSEDVNDRAEYKRLIDENDLELKELAMTLVTSGLIHAVTVKSRGKTKEGYETFILVAGHRRTSAAIYLYASGISREKEPTILATLFDGNSVDCAILNQIENMHIKRLRPSEQARAYKQQLNTGMSIEELATREGVSVATLRNRLTILEMEPEVQKQIDNKEIKITAAVQQHREENPKRPRKKKDAANGSSNNGATKTNNNPLASRPSPGTMRSFRGVYERYNTTEFAYERSVLAWVLGREWIPADGVSALEGEFERMVSAKELEEYAD